MCISFLFVYFLRDRKLYFWNCLERWKYATLRKQEWQHDAERETYENLTSLRAAICSGNRCIFLSCGIPSNRSGRIRSVPLQFPSVAFSFVPASPEHVSVDRFRSGYARRSERRTREAGKTRACKERNRGRSWRRGKGRGEQYTGRKRKKETLPRKRNSEIKELRKPSITQDRSERGDEERKESKNRERKVEKKERGGE